MEERGCEAAGYRLAGAAVEHVCCRHLYGSDRVLTVWPAEDRAVVLLVGPHSGRAGDVYLELLDALGVDVPADEREKPSCCDDEGVPPVEEVVAEAIAEAVERSARRVRRR
jgi:hypothetical protein